ncbi:hypothetical protein N0V93_002202 [Gnomoniopsis smithogilvyi]|uniref:Cytochrome P450 n=1 Tax=Gnomoniopsis smithogilvyi TaxID=1191159 RepID=A0A9W9CYV0_9PEZI|nr:hypothetical protein N0V93_002202 [Gnomoniopsis smithogilvyi]
MLTLDRLLGGHVPIILTLAILIYLTYRFIIYPAFLSPLAALPNAHWSARFSPLWILYKRYAHRENGALVAAHKRLGPYVRTAPNEVSVDDVEGIKQIYMGGFEKPEWYAIFDNYGVPCMFSERHSKEHSLRKRMVSNVYSKSFLQSSPSAAAQAKVLVHERFLPAIEASLAEQGLDVYSLFLAVVMDFISAYIWGLARSTNFVQDKGYREHWLELYKSRNDYPFFPQELPRLTAFCKRLGLWLYPRWVDDANRELAAWNSALCERTVEDLTTASKASIDGADEPVVMTALLAGLDKEAARSEKSPIHATAVLQRDLTIQSELWDHVLAGQETAGLALTYLTWRLSQHPDLQAALHTELLTLPTDAVDDPKALDSLPLLHAIVLETLRLHAPIPGAQPREVRFPSAEFGPYTIPGGVRIAGMAQTLHRDENVFPDPEKWDPRRWLEGDEEKLRTMHRQWWAFSSGGQPRMSILFHMADPC